MASTEISAITTLISGKAAVTVTSTTFSTGETITISGPGGKPLDFSTLAVRIANSSSGTAIVGSITAQSKYSGASLGDYAFTVASSGTVYIGGKEFESARFKNLTAGTLVITIGAATAGAKIEAVQAPYAHLE